MDQIDIIIQNKNGIHARPAALIAKTSSKYESDVFIQKDSIKVSAKSIMGLLTIEAQYGTKLTISAEGNDSKQALDDLKKIIDNKFGFDE